MNWMALRWGGVGGVTKWCGALGIPLGKLRSTQRQYPEQYFHKLSRSIWTRAWCIIVHNMRRNLSHSTTAHWPPEHSQLINKRSIEWRIASLNRIFWILSFRLTFSVSHLIGRFVRLKLKIARSYRNATRNICFGSVQRVIEYFIRFGIGQQWFVATPCLACDEMGSFHCKKYLKLKSIMVCSSNCSNWGKGYSAMFFFTIRRLNVHEAWLTGRLCLVPFRCLD